MIFYLEVKRQRPPSVRAELYWMLDQLKDVVDQDFDTNERAKIEQALTRALEHSQNVEQRQIIHALRELVQMLPSIAPPPPNLFKRG